MKISEIPNEAWVLTPPTPLPQKTVVMYDWEALHQTLQNRGFIIIESDSLRVLPSGVEECIPVKAFNSYLHSKKAHLRTKRIGAIRWFCTL
jgi:hypothetical protein